MDRIDEDLYVISGHYRNGIYDTLHDLTSLKH
jgi:hypothetical protein